MITVRPMNTADAAALANAPQQANRATTPTRVDRLTPASPTTPAAPQTQPGPLPPLREPPRTGTAYQSNADGDSVTLTSKLDQLSDAERRQVSELQARDTEVRTHEQAHVAAAGSLFRGGPYYQYKTGPDGREYAVAGRVNIDTSEGRTPEETLARAQQIRRAALAPAEPSSTDQRVAAKAAAMEARAQKELAESRSDNEPDPTDPSADTATNPTNPINPSNDATQRTAAASAFNAATNNAPNTATGQLKLDTYA